MYVHFPLVAAHTVLWVQGIVGTVCACYSDIFFVIISANWHPNELKVIDNFSTSYGCFRWCLLGIGFRRVSFDHTNSFFRTTSVILVSSNLCRCQVLFEAEVFFLIWECLLFVNLSKMYQEELKFLQNVTRIRWECGKNPILMIK